jgi:integrase
VRLPSLSKSCSRPTQSSWADWLNKGINPKVKLDEIKAEERRQTEQAEARTAANEATAKGELVTFRQACELYSKLPAIRNNWTNADYEWQWFHQLEVHIFPKLGDVPVAHIDRRKVLEVLEPIWGSKTIADVRGRIEKVLDWCEGKGWRPEGLLNPAAKAALTKAGLPAPRKGAHAVVAHPALPYEDVRAFIAALPKRTAFLRGRSRY